MPQDWTSGLDDDDAKDAMPLLASPLTAAGQDPDLVRLQMLRQGLPIRAGAPQGWTPASGGVPPGTSARPVMAGSPPSAPPAPAPPAAPATPPAGSQPTTLGAGNTGLEELLSTGRAQRDTAEQEGQVDPQIAELTVQRERDAAAAPNPANYRPGFGTRLMRGLRSVGLGIAAGGIPGAVVGALDPGYFGKSYSAPTDAYDTALEQNKAAVAADTQDLTDAQNLFKQRQDALAARARGLGDTSGTFGKLVTGATGLSNADTSARRLPIEQEQADTARLNAQNNSPQAKVDLTNLQFQQRQQQADRQGLRGEARTLYILNGKLPDPRQPTADEIASTQAMRVFIREHGRGPNTLEEFQQVQAAARGGTGRGGGANDANLREAARLASLRVKDLETRKSKDSLLGQWTSDDEDQLTQASADNERLQQQLLSNGESDLGGSPKPAQRPPDSLLAKTPEGGAQYGRNGEVWYKVNGQWSQTPAKQ